MSLGCTSTSAQQFKYCRTCFGRLSRHDGRCKGLVCGRCVGILLRWKVQTPQQHNQHATGCNTACVGPVCCIDLTSNMFLHLLCTCMYRHQFLKRLHCSLWWANVVPRWTALSAVYLHPAVGTMVHSGAQSGDHVFAYHLVMMKQSCNEEFDLEKTFFPSRGYCYVIVS